MFQEKMHFLRKTCKANKEYLLTKVLKDVRKVSDYKKSHKKRLVCQYESQ